VEFVEQPGIAWKRIFKQGTDIFIGGLAVGNPMPAKNPVSISIDDEDGMISGV
jgi:hypothetical protein